MSLRHYIRSALSAVDRRLGMREWLWRDDHAAQDQWFTLAAEDPYASTPELIHPKPATVLDIGGSHGQFAQEIFRAFPEATIYSFEPIPECFAELQALANAHANLHPIQLALSDREGEAELHVSQFRDSSSLQRMLPAHTEAWPHTAIEADRVVRVTQLDEAVRELRLTPPVMAKLDVQGHELQVIRGGRATLSQCQRVIVECNFAPLYEGQPSFGDLHEALCALDFHFDGFVGHLRHPRTHELMSADLVFFRAAAAPWNGDGKR